MNINKPNMHALVALNLPRNNDALAAYAAGIVKAMTGNSTFPTPAPTLAALQQAATDLTSAELLAKTRAKGTVSARNDKRFVLVHLLQQLRGYVQGVADSNRETGATTIESAGMAVKHSPTRTARVFHAKSGVTSGTAILYAPSAGNRVSYDWEYSLDGGKTWVSAPGTLTAKATIGGLPVGTQVQFRYRSLTKAGEGNWSQPYTLTVQ